MAIGPGQELDVRRRRLLFRAWHRGMRELDLIMGRFADSAIGQLTWVTGEAKVWADFDTALFRRLRDFNRRGEGAR